MKILSRVRLREEIQKIPDFYNVIAIGETESMLEGIKELCKDVLTILFADVISLDRKDAPTLNQVKECIDWGLNKDNLLISCSAGISRSSSIAYLLNCVKSGSPQSGIDILDVNHHRPNQLILCYGNKIFGKDVIQPVYDLYNNALQEQPKNPSIKFYLHDLDIMKRKILE